MEAHRSQAGMAFSLVYSFVIKEYKCNNSPPVGGEEEMIQFCKNTSLVIKIIKIIKIMYK
jgi:hypothetical protein